MRLLIADSDPMLTDVYESFFAAQGYKVVTVPDAAQCLKATREHAPDVLVLEYELPSGGGDGVLASLRQDFPLAPFDVVLITGDYSIEEVADQLGPPVVACLRKPFRLRELSATVRSATQDSPRQPAATPPTETTGADRRAV